MHGQRSAKNNIKCQTESRPPTRDPWIFDKQVMDEVKTSVPNNGSGNQPKIFSKAKCGK